MKQIHIVLLLMSISAIHAYESSEDDYHEYPALSDMGIIKRIGINNIGEVIGDVRPDVGEHLRRIKSNLRYKGDRMSLRQKRSFKRRNSNTEEDA